MSTGAALAHGAARLDDGQHAVDVAFTSSVGRRAALRGRGAAFPLLGLRGARGGQREEQDRERHLDGLIP